MSAIPVVVVVEIDHGYEVIVGDCVSPGEVVHTTTSRDEANRICIALATILGIRRALPLGDEETS